MTNARLFEDENRRLTLPDFGLPPGAVNEMPYNSGSVCWRSSEGHLVLDHTEVHVWRVPLAPPPERHRSLAGFLNDEERRRAARFHFAEDRDRFITARGSLRLLLGNYLNRLPNEVRFRYTANGRPELDGEESPPRCSFNLSHSHELGLCAFTRGRRVGVDVERVSPDKVNCSELAERFFTPAEAEMIRSRPPSAQARIFYRLWTRKEAYLKGLGAGLNTPLNQFEVSLDDSRIRFFGERTEVGSDWRLHELHPWPGYIGSLAVEGAGLSLKLWALS